MSFNIEVEGGKSVRLTTAGKYCDRDIVVSAKGGSVTYPVADEPETIGQMACLARAAQMRDIVYSPVGDLYLLDGKHTAGEMLTGLPYSSVRKTDLFVGYNVSIHTFMTAIHNPKSILYTQRSSEYNASCWYGVNCTIYVSYAHDLKYHTATAELPDLEYIEPVSIYDLKLCDIGCYVDGASGHAILITGIDRDENGNIVNVEYSESDRMGMKKTVKTFEAMRGQAYHYYRNKKLYEAEYEPTPYVKLFDEPNTEIVYSDICTNLGDRVSITTDDSIVLNPLKADGYTGIKLYKDGTEVGSYTVTDVELSNLTPGKYIARLIPETENASTKFSVHDVSVSQNGNRYSFSGDSGTPVRVVFKDADGYTRKVVDLTEDDVFNGYVDIDYTDESAAQICVPFKTEYGFVVARCEYAPPAVEKLLPEEYQQVSYIETDGNQYIDTGVKASDHADGIRYKMEGHLINRTNDTGNNYFWGCLANNSRSGNMSLKGDSGTMAVFVGGASVVVLEYNPRPANESDFVLELTATSSNASSISASLNGSAFSASVAQTPSEMPAANIYLFSANGVSASNGKYWGKLYSFTMDAVDGTPIRNFVPCYRKADNVIGLYDIVNNAFYTNAGSGSFTKGVDV